MVETTLLQCDTFELMEHSCHTVNVVVPVQYPPCRSPLDHLNLMNIPVGIGVPNRGAILDPWSYWAIVCLFLDVVIIDVHIPSVRLSLVVMFLMCLFHDKSQLIVRPRYLALLTTSSGWLLRA